MTVIHQMKNIVAANLFLCSILFFGAGCSSTNPPASNNNNSSATVKPKMGSTFTDSLYYKDTSLVDMHAKGQIMVYTLIDTNATVAGKSSVYIFASTFDSVYQRFDTVYQHYETNGDLSVYAPFGAGPFVVGSEWVTFPFATQTTSNIQTFKGVVIDTVTIAGHVQGSGSGTSVISGQSLATQNVTMNVDATSIAAGDIPATLKLTYAPSIGYITHQELTDRGSALGINLTGGSNKFLISYILK